MDKAKLLGDRMPTEKVALPNGGEVTVRALSRAAIHLLRPDDGGPTDVEARMLHLGLVDPAITEDEAHQWMGNVAQSEIQTVTDVISRLSGIGRYSDKDATKSPSRERKRVR